MFKQKFGCITSSWLQHQEAVLFLVIVEQNGNGATHKAHGLKKNNAG